MPSLPPTKNQDSTHQHQTSQGTCRADAWKGKPVGDSQGVLRALALAVSVGTQSSQQRLAGLERLVARIHDLGNQSNDESAPERRNGREAGMHLVGKRIALSVQHTHQRNRRDGLACTPTAATLGSKTNKNEASEAS